MLFCVKFLHIRRLYVMRERVVDVISFNIIIYIYYMCLHKYIHIIVHDQLDIRDQQSFHHSPSSAVGFSRSIDLGLSPGATFSLMLMLSGG